MMSAVAFAVSAQPTWRPISGTTRSMRPAAAAGDDPGDIGVFAFGRPATVAEAIAALAGGNLFRRSRFAAVQCSRVLEVPAAERVR